MNKAKLNSLYGMQVSTISKILIELQFNASSIGFKYWATAIEIYRKNYFKYNNTIENVYNDVAKIHNTTRTRVERDMRAAKSTATRQIQTQFNYYNKTVLEILTHNYRILFDKFSNHIPRID